MNISDYHTHPYAAALQKLRRSVLSYKVLPVLLLPPVIAIYMRIAYFEVPVVLINVLIADAVFLLLFVFLRVALLLSECRWGLIPVRRPEVRDAVKMPHAGEADLHSLLKEGGYHYASASSQGIKCTRITVTALLMVLAGLSIVVPVGLYDNLKQFSGIVYVGTGEPVKLNSIDYYGVYFNGLLADPADITYKLRGYEHFPPSEKYPQGAKELALTDMQDKELWRGILTPNTRFRYGNYQFYFDDFVFDVFLYIETLQNHHISSERVRCKITAPPDGSFTHKGPLAGEIQKVAGVAWYEPKDDRLRVVAEIKGAKFDVMLGMGPDHMKEVGDIRFKFTGVGKWAHVNVMRVRNILILKIGGGVLLAGAVLYALFPFRRVHVVRGDSGLRVVTRDKRLRERLSAGTGIV